MAARGLTPKIVGVIFSPADLARAIRLRSAPDLFELRLDALGEILDRLEASLPKLAAPLIITARDPREGGAHALAESQRRALLERFLSCASYLDVELRGARNFAAILAAGRSRAVRLIFSFHDFGSMPAAAALSRKSESAARLGADIFKIAVRVDTSAQLDRLLAFFDENSATVPLAAMGMGVLGRQSRLELARRGSALNYAHLGVPQAEGQLSLAQLRAALRNHLSERQAPSRP